MSLQAMFTAIGREWRLARSHFVVPATIVIVIGLTGLALFTGWQRTAHRLARESQLEAENSLQQQFLLSAFAERPPNDEPAGELSSAQQHRRSELHMAAKSPDMMRFTGGIWWTTFPASSLSRLSAGAAREWRDHYAHAGASAAQTLGQTLRPNPRLATTGVFDLTLMIGVILPLAVIVLTHNVVAADREQGRWSLLAVHTPSLPPLIVTRCLLRAVVLGIAVIALVAGAYLVTSVVSWDLVSLRNFVVWSSGLLAYLAFWAAVAVWVASLPLSSSAAGLLLLLCWSVLVIWVPTAVGSQVNREFPLAPPTDLVAIEDDLRKQAEKSSEEIWAEFLRQNQELTLDDENPQQEYLLRDIALNRVIRQRVREHIEQRYQQFLDREAALDRAQFYSPTLAWRTIANETAGVSQRHYIEFARQTLQFHETYLRYFEPFSMAGKELSRSDLQAIPRFDTQHLETRLHPTPLKMSAGSLFLWIVAVALFSCWTLRRRK